jgi:hypothetical protein
MCPIVAFHLFTQRDELHGSGLSLSLALSMPCPDFAIP